MRYFTIFMIIFLCNTDAKAQELESITFVDSYSKVELGALFGISVSYGVDLYKVRYFTNDIESNQSIASGLLCVPQAENLIFPLAAYQHGTVDGREDVPSRLAGGFQLPMILASYGYVVCAPDMLGLGDSPGIHMYVHAKTEATAAIDMLLAIRDNDENEDIYQLNEQLFITGYSQGGHAAMALHREIEENFSSSISVTASAPMSGPYSMSGLMIDFSLGDADYSSVSYLAWVVLAYQVAYADILSDYSLEDIFKASYIDDILEFKNENIDRSELNRRMTDTLLANVGRVTPKDMLHDSIVDALKNDANHPLSVALRDNDVYDWVPEAPLRMYYCVGDDQIVYTNATMTDSVMNANGALDVEAVQNDIFSPLDHGGCVIPASFAGIVFFQNYQNILTSSDQIEFNPNLKLHYNNAYLWVNVPDDFQTRNLQMLIYDMKGSRVVSRSLNRGQSIFDLNTLSQGMFVVHIINGQQLVKSQKIVRF
ncbi:MAG: T9SS type A sorting domain-containing protein [Saprospiraceae bacterium]|nr:T9SS type A sorting domain-containing protein [Saprospiraceae bacterium]